MKKVIPEQVTHYCDKCGVEVEKSKIDCTGAADIVGRDWRGCAVGGHRKEFELCSTCTNGLLNYLNNKL